MGTLKTKARLLLSSLLGRSFTSISPSTPIISFDVFDTLVIRDVPFPTDVFERLSTDPSFKTRRIEAEKIARAKSSKEDITLEEIYKVIMPTASDEELRQAMEREINAELKVCKANKPTLTFFNACKESGKKIIIISDMYLDSSTIEEILQNCGYDLADVPIYVSSEYGKTKRSGNLFRTVLEHEEVEAGKVLHIGDNLISDYLMPEKCGMKSFLYRRV